MLPKEEIRLQLVLLLLAICPVLALAQPASRLAPYDQPYRPQYHFSPRENWTNDPNGLVYSKASITCSFNTTRLAMSGDT